MTVSPSVPAGSEKPDTTDSIGEFKVGQLVMVAGRSEGRAIIVRLEANSRAFLLCQDGTDLCADLAQLQPVELPKMAIYRQQVWCEEPQAFKALSPK